MTPAVLAVDAGQTEIRATLNGRVATAPGVRRMGEGVGPDEVSAALLAAIAGLGPLPRPAPALGLGLSGFEAAAGDDLRRVSELLLSELGVERLAIASDGLTSLLGALGDADGAVVAAGTGAVCVGRRGEGLVKVDGWGALLGDAGSGFAIGRAGLDAALRHADGRDGSEALLQAAEARYAPLPGLTERIYGAPVPARAIAAFAVDVAEAAAAGDPRAGGIIEGAGRELALSAAAALDRLFDRDLPATVSYAGNVFRCGPSLLEPFERTLLERRPQAQVVPPEGDSLAGAAVLAAPGRALRPAPGLLWAAP